MKGMVHILYADGDRMHSPHYAPLTLTFIQTCVGGDAEQVPQFNCYHDQVCVAFANEEGKRLGLPINKEATEIWRRQIHLTDEMLRGDVLVVTGDREFMEAL